MMLSFQMGGNPIPSENAFLVQLAEDVDPAHGELSGRVEHLESGRRARFGSHAELLVQFAPMLEERRRATGPKTEPEEG